MIEPRFYLPILPLVLINGAEGIGTGWSTTIHPHRVEDVIELVRNRINMVESDISIGW
jgi:DNA topoisomerase-2